MCSTCELDTGQGAKKNIFVESDGEERPHGCLKVKMMRMHHPNISRDTLRYLLVVIRMSYLCAVSGHRVNDGINP